MPRMSPCARVKAAHSILPLPARMASSAARASGEEDDIIDPEQAVVLRGPRLAAIIKQFFFDTLWPELDYLIIDLPPGTGMYSLHLYKQFRLRVS